jgi:hypothetical protein
MGNFILQKGPCSFLKLRISPWEVLIPFLPCSSSLSALSPYWCLLSFPTGGAPFSSSLPRFGCRSGGALGVSPSRVQRQSSSAQVCKARPRQWRAGSARQRAGRAAHAGRGLRRGAREPRQADGAGGAGRLVARLGRRAGASARGRPGRCARAARRGSGGAQERDRRAPWARERRRAGDVCAGGSRRWRAGRGSVLAR